MSALGAVLGKRTWLGAGAILLAAAGGCALGALLVVKGVLPEGGALAWGCGCWALAAFAGGRVAVWGRGEGDADGGSGRRCGGVPAGVADGCGHRRPDLPHRRAVPDSRHLRRRRSGGPAGEQTPKKAPGRQTADPKACPAEIGSPERRGENHENAAAAKISLTGDYTNRNHAYRQDVGPKPDRPAPYLDFFDPKRDDLIPRFARLT